jgi:hypothetical protein
MVYGFFFEKADTPTNGGVGFTMTDCLIRGANGSGSPFMVENILKDLYIFTRLGGRAKTESKYRKT